MSFRCYETSFNVIWTTVAWSEFLREERTLKRLYRLINDYLIAYHGSFGSWKRALFQWKLLNKELKACRWNYEMLSCIWRSYSYLRLATACSTIARTSFKIRIVQIICLPNKTIAVNHKLNFSWTFSFEWLSREERSLPISLFSWIWMSTKCKNFCDIFPYSIQRFH